MKTSPMHRNIDSRIILSAALALLLAIGNLEHAQGQSAYPNVFGFPGGTWGHPVDNAAVQGPGGSLVLLGVTSDGNGAYYSSSGVGATLLHTFTQTTSHPATNPLVFYDQGSPKVFGTVQNGSHPKLYNMPVLGFPVPSTYPFGSQNDDGVHNPIGNTFIDGTTLYGATLDGGLSGKGAGSIYSVALDGSWSQEIFDFGSLGLSSGEANPLGGVSPAYTLDNGVYKLTLFGTTQYTAGGGPGEIFKVFADGTGFQVLHTFDGTDGANPVATLSIKDGFIYGSTKSGGASGDGTLFRINLDGSGFYTLHTFSGLDGAHPVGTFNGFMGSTFNGGTYDDGTVFLMNPDGSIHTLHSFNGADGANPNSGFAQQLDGFYATTQNGGANNAGTIYVVSLPEPSSIVLGTLGLLALIVRARSRRHSRRAT